jgi:hypothetical protein
MTAKTDNHNPAAKLALRRYFLDRFHASKPIEVFDCCQGSSALWSQLKNEYQVAKYWGVDLKPKKGRLKIDSVRILEQGISENVIDVDTYGEPWKHWVALLPHIKKPTTVFLTIATIKMAGGGVISRESMRALGFDRLPSMPQTFCRRMAAIVPDLMLPMAWQFCTIEAAAESFGGGNARYIGVHLIPKNQPAVDATG